MSPDKSADMALQAARAELSRLAHGLQPTAGVDSLRFNLMCAAGLDIIDDDRLQPSDRMRFTGEHPEDVIESVRERGDYVAHEALCEIAADLVRRGAPLPQLLGNYIIGSARRATPRRRGNHRIVNHWRDYAICRAVAATGLSPTRNEASEAPCGVSVVSIALAEFGIKLSEARVKKIWEGRHPQWIKPAPRA